MIIVKGFYLPGFSEPERNIKKEKELEEYNNKNGGLELSNLFGYALKSTVPLLVEGFDNDPRNFIVGSCVKYNCMSQIWWMISYEGSEPWSVYAGSWNDKLGVMVYEDSQTTPSVWISEDPSAMRDSLWILML